MLLRLLPESLDDLPLLRSSGGTDGADLVAEALGEPQVAVGTQGDAIWIAARRGDGELGEHPRRSDPPDLVAAELDEPQVAVGAGRDVVRVAGRRGDAELGEHPRGGDPPDVVAQV